VFQRTHYHHHQFNFVPFFFIVYGIGRNKIFAPRIFQGLLFVFQIRSFHTHENKIGRNVNIIYFEETYDYTIKTHLN